MKGKTPLLFQRAGKCDLCGWRTDSRAQNAMLQVTRLALLQVMLDYLWIAYPGLIRVETSRSPGTTLA